MRASSRSVLTRLGAALLAGASLCSAAEVAAPKDSLAAFVERYARALQGRDLDGYKRDLAVAKRVIELLEK